MDRILERRLLSPHVIVLVDNGTLFLVSLQVPLPLPRHSTIDIWLIQSKDFARGLTMGNEFNPYIEKI